MSGEVFAARDSTSFARTNVTSKNNSVPIGTVIHWPFAHDPDDMENWLECKGQTVNPVLYPELVKAIGGTRVPDLQGKFLRGSGGKAAALGTTQQEHVYLDAEGTGVTYSAAFDGLVPGAATYSSYSGMEEYDCYGGEYPSCKERKVYTPHYVKYVPCEYGSHVYEYAEAPGWYYRADGWMPVGDNAIMDGACKGIVIGSGTAEYDFKLRSNSGVTETRPINQSVRYLIRAL